MKIEPSTPNSTPYTGLGAGIKTNSHTEKKPAALFASPATNSTAAKAYETGDSSPLSHFLKANASPSLSQVQHATENQNAKREPMEDLLAQLGINGQVTAMGGETSPQSYTTYYVQTQGSAKNLFILELENGELLYAETDQDPDQLTRSFDLARAGLGARAGVEELKGAFTTFFGAEKVKDLFLAYAASFDPKKLEDIFFAFWDATKNKENATDEPHKPYDASHL